MYRSNGGDTRRIARERGEFSMIDRTIRLAITLLALAVPATASAQTAAEVAKANNPLAPVTAINFHDYYLSSLYGVPNQTANAMLLRPVLATTRMIIRGTLPLSTVPSGASGVSGLGDFSIFDAFLLTSSESRTQFGVGPLLVVPTATDDRLGAGKWQAGGALVGVSSVAPTVMLFGLVTYQHSFAGDASRATASLLTAQPGAIIQLGGRVLPAEHRPVAVPYSNRRLLDPVRARRRQGAPRRHGRAERVPRAAVHRAA